jgi:two-component system alkaline phosphatase synthesis response regulator PhoP
MGDEKKSVLLVDDEEDVVVLLQLVFETNNFRTRTAGNGKVAVAMAYEDPPDAIILDVMMSRDGWQVLKILKGDERTRHSVVMLSARAERRDKMIGLRRRRATSPSPSPGRGRA